MKNFKIMLCLMVSLMLAVSCFAFVGCDSKDSDSTGSSGGGKLDDIFDDYFGDSGDDGGDGGDEVDDGSVTYTPGTIRLECEYSKFDCPGGRELRIEHSANCSNGDAVAYFYDGNSMIFVINCDKAETDVSFTICAASSKEAYPALLEISAEEVASIVSVNGTGTLNNPTGKLPGSANRDGNWYNLGTVTGTIDLVEGENIIKLTCQGTAMNFDYVELVTKEASVTWIPEDNDY